MCRPFILMSYQTIQCGSRASDERVYPPQARKSRHVGVGRVKLGLVLDRQGGKVRVRRQIAGGARRRKKIEEDIRMTISGVNENRLRLGEPRPDASASAAYVERIVEYLRVRGDANES